MNYLQEVVAFTRWKEVNPLPATAIALWYELMAINNKCGWKKEFTVPNGLLQSYAGLSRKQLDNARMKLIEHNLIDYQKGKRANQAGKYSMIPFVQNGQREEHGKHTESTQEAHGEDNTEGTLFKPKRNENEIADDGAPALNPIELYENNIGPIAPMNGEKIWSWVDDTSQELVCFAIETAVERNARSYGLIDSILREWTNNNIDTVEKARQYQEQRQRQFYSKGGKPTANADSQKSEWQQKQDERMSQVW